MDRANDVMALLAEGKFNPNTLAYRSLREEELKLDETERIQVVSILTPHFLHYPMAKKLLENVILLMNGIIDKKVVLI